jgi:SAM-dependent methyltransferase
MASAFYKKLQRAVAVYQEGGVAGLWRRVAGRVSGGQERSQWLQHKAQVDKAFDATHGTRTGGIEEIYDFEIVGENARYGQTHIATDPNEFAGMMDEIGVDFSSFTFVDLGSGRGRALILAAAYPFRRIIGVEFALELHRAAQENIALVIEHGLAASQIELVHGDALNYRPPNDPLIIYLFNPFSSTAVRQVATSIMESWRAAPRPIRILYMNPIFLSDFLTAGWKKCNESTFYACLSPADG